VAGIIEAVITGSEGGGMAPLPAGALPSLQLYKRARRIEESNWERFMYMAFKKFVLNLRLFFVVLRNIIF
jgi:hypothetical protein